MKVSELIEALKPVPPDTTVIMSSDAEGNAYHDVGGLEAGEVTRTGTAGQWGSTIEPVFEGHNEKAKKESALYLFPSD